MKVLISAITGVTVSAATVVSLRWYVDQVKRDEQNAVLATFNKGQKFPKTKGPYIPRPAAEEMLRDKLVPTCWMICKFALLFGENGTGKTTSVKKLASEAVDGVVYVAVPSGGEKRSFGEALADAIGAHSKYEPFSMGGLLSTVGILPQRSNTALVCDCVDLILTAAAEYRTRNNGRPPLLIVDNIDHFLKHKGGAELLLLLQDIAKSCAVRFPCTVCSTFFVHDSPFSLLR
jgi:Cdc6-like AAA superfamily ATPase